MWEWTGAGLQNNRLDFGAWEMMVVMRLSVREGGWKGMEGDGRGGEREGYLKEPQ